MDAGGGSGRGIAADDCGGLEGGDPDAVGGGAAEGDRLAGDVEGEGRVGVGGQHFEGGAGVNAERVQIAEEFAVAFKGAADFGARAGRQFGEGKPAEGAALFGGIETEAVAVGAGVAVAEFFDEFLLELGADGVFELLGFFMDKVPGHAEDFREHAFDEVVAADEALGDFAARGGEDDDAAVDDADEFVAFEAAEGHGDGRSADLEPAGESGGNDEFAFAFGFGDGFEVVFLGDGDFQGNLFIVTLGLNSCAEEIFCL